VLCCQWPVTNDFGLPEGVAQDCILLYRRFVICCPDLPASIGKFDEPAGYNPAIQQVANLRYVSGLNT